MILWIRFDVINLISNNMHFSRIPPEILQYIFSYLFFDIGYDSFRTKDILFKFDEMSDLLESRSVCMVWFYNLEKMGIYDLMRFFRSSRFGRFSTKDRILAIKGCRSYKRKIHLEREVQFRLSFPVGFIEEPRTIEDSPTVSFSGLVGGDPMYARRASFFEDIDIECWCAPFDEISFHNISRFEKLRKRSKDENFFYFSTRSPFRNEHGDFVHPPHHKRKRKAKRHYKMVYTFFSNRHHKSPRRSFTNFNYSHR